jgi:erythritol kinase (D-erythritol 1-phosphate-forming)
MGVTPCQQYAQLAWLKTNKPHVLAKAATAFHCKDWLYFNLTGECATDPSEGNFTYGRYDGRSYQPDVLDALGIGETKSLLPPMVDGSAVSHPLSASASEATGLPQGLPVCLGYVDVVCSGLGGGLFDAEGKAGCTIVGSTGMHMRMRKIEEVKLSPERTGMLMCLPYQTRVAQMQSNMASTLNIDWLLDLALGILKEQGIERKRGELLKNLDARVLDEAPGRLIYHPYISHAGERGPFLEPAARAGFAGLEQGMGFAALMRGVFEGLCHAARDCYQAMGDMPHEVRLTGGAARSQALRLMMASALNAPVRTVVRDEAGAAGAVMMAAVQQKIYPDMAAAVERWVTPQLSAPTLPDPLLVSTFDRTYPIYKDMRQFMGPLWRQLKETHA